MKEEKENRKYSETGDGEVVRKLAEMEQDDISMLPDGMESIEEAMYEEGN